MTDDIPHSAMERAAEWTNKTFGKRLFQAAHIGNSVMGRAFASYIVEHEGAPLKGACVTEGDMYCDHDEPCAATELEDNKTAIGETASDTSDEIPQWAYVKVDQYIRAPNYRSVLTLERYADLLRELAASLIAERGEPIDPLMKEAREVAAKYYLEEGCHSAAAKCRSGEWDNGAAVKWRLEGLRRGIELGKAGAA